MPEAGTQAEYIIFNGKFGHNVLCHRSIEQCSNSRSELLQNVHVSVIPTRLHIFELFVPNAFIKEVVIPHTNNIMVEGRGEYLPMDSSWSGYYFLVKTSAAPFWWFEDDLSTHLKTTTG